MEPDERPDPDALLEEIGGAESGGGRLKIFLGMCPGVGKTFAMLLAGQTRQEEGAEAECLRLVGARKGRVPIIARKRDER